VLHFEATPDFPKPESNMKKYEKGNIEIRIMKQNQQALESNLGEVR